MPWLPRSPIVGAEGCGGQTGSVDQIARIRVVSPGIPHRRRVRDLGMPNHQTLAVNLAFRPNKCLIETGDGNVRDRPAIPGTKRSSMTESDPHAPLWLYARPCKERTRGDQRMAIGFRKSPAGKSLAHRTLVERMNIKRIANIDC